MTLAEFREGIVVSVFGQWAVRVSHPTLPGLYVIGFVEAGKPVDETQNRCINALFKDFTDLQEWNIL